MDMNTTYIVKNRSASRVGYRIAEDGIRREFAPGETKKIRFAELEKLNYQPGGRELMANFLQIQSTEALDELGIRTEPEYHMSEADIAELIARGSLDQFLDFLDFAPTGEIDLLKALAVKVPLSDYDKRIALKNKTGFDVDKALSNLAAEKAEEKEKAETASGRERRVKTTSEEPATPTRRTYNVVSVGK